MRKPAFCICENKDADQLRGNREADQRLGFCYIDSFRAIPLLSKYQISSLYPSSEGVQPGLCLTRSETTLLVFSCRGSFIVKFDLSSQGTPTMSLVLPHSGSYMSLIVRKLVFGVSDQVRD